MWYGQMHEQVLADCVTQAWAKARKCNRRWQTLKPGTGTHGAVAGLAVYTRRPSSGSKPLLSFLPLSGRRCQQ